MSEPLMLNPAGQRTSASRLRFVAWLSFWAAALACLYLPTLATRFDFIDDGNLVYPSGPMPLGERLQSAWGKVEANYRHLGPFRPVLWAHWEVEAELFGADPFRWRCARLVWLALATAMLLWLLRELGMRPGATVLVVALAMWNPYRNEVWTSLTLSEGVAMPYALLALVCAVRAARSPRPGGWDIGGALCVLAALGCKNTFAALVPAQVLLRFAPEGRAFQEGWRRHGKRACLLTLTLLVPIAHYLFFKLNWQPGQYETAGPSWAQLGRMLRTLSGAISVDFIAPGLALVVLALYLHRRTLRRSGSEREASPGVLGTVWHQHRAACLAGALLLVGGVGIYLPLDAVSGRYSMPAVWGLDLLIAALLSTLAGAVCQRWWRTTALAVLGCGLTAVLIANLGKQDKFAARAALLWQTLEYVERTAPPNACLGWVSDPLLDSSEGVHFYWHLHARGRGDLTICLLDAQGQPLPRCEVPQSKEPPLLVISSPARVFPGNGWHVLNRFSARYWGGRRHHDCCLWSRADRRQARSGKDTVPEH